MRAETWEITYELARDRADQAEREAKELRAENLELRYKLADVQARLKIYELLEGEAFRRGVSALTQFHSRKVVEQ
jgi:hypothetical protein